MDFDAVGSAAEEGTSGSGDAMWSSDPAACDTTTSTSASPDPDSPLPASLSSPFRLFSSKSEVNRSLTTTKTRRKRLKNLRSLLDESFRRGGAKEGDEDSEEDGDGGGDDDGGGGGDAAEDGVSA